MPRAIDSIIALYEAGSARVRPGHQVSASHHALQCGLAAERARAGSAMVAAALLHDLGTVLADELAGCFGHHHNLHAYRALPYLRELFGPEVVEPIRLHVEARRFLLARNPVCGTGLSPAEGRSLERNGGALGPAEAEAFLREPFAAQALQLCRWDAQAHSPTRTTPGWWYFRPLLVALAQQRPAQLLAA